MSKLFSTSFIGAGNVAWHLAPAIDNTDFPVREVFSRNPKHASELVSKLYEADVKKTLDFSSSLSRLFILAVPDDVIEDVVEQITLPDDAILVHTSGSQPLTILDKANVFSTGVFYPLQTFSKDKKVDFKEVPLFIESGDKQTEHILATMAKAISKKVYRISSKERRALHLAAVFASNFSNHMLAIAEEIMMANKLDFNVLKPLIEETINKSLAIGPTKAQTGPARRADLSILDMHMKLLKGKEPLDEIYRLISQHILDRYES